MRIYFIGIKYRNRYEINEFNTFLAQTIELLFHLYQKGDSDIRNAVCALFDRLTSVRFDYCLISIHLSIF